jgi:hypothetical protein
VALQGRLSGLAALTLAAVAALGGCGAREDAASEPPPPPTTPETDLPTTTSTTPRATGDETSPPDQDNRCTSAMLSGTVEPQDAGAGNRYAMLVVTNKSQQLCTLWGYGGLELIDEVREVLPTQADRNLDPEPTLVTLKPGATAGKTLHWSVVATGDEPTEGPCQPPATAARILPPDETEPFEVDFDFGPVCAQGRIETSAYFPN